MLPGSIGVAVVRRWPAHVEWHDTTTSLRRYIDAAEKSGALKPAQTVIEATSGNTGIGLAMVCARRGYPLVVVTAENFSIERRKIMRFRRRANVVLTPAAEKGMGMLGKAVELARQHGWFLTRQFENVGAGEDEPARWRGLRHSELRQERRSERYGAGAPGLRASRRLHRLDPFVYMEEILRVLPYWPRDRILSSRPSTGWRRVAASDPSR